MLAAYVRGQVGSVCWFKNQGGLGTKLHPGNLFDIHTVWYKSDPLHDVSKNSGPSDLCLKIAAPQISLLDHPCGVNLCHKPSARMRSNDYGTCSLV